MKNTFAAEYEQELKIRKDYDLAEMAGSEDGQEEARAAIHRLWDSIEAKGKASTGNTQKPWTRATPTSICTT